MLPLPILIAALYLAFVCFLPVIALLCRELDLAFMRQRSERRLVRAAKPKRRAF